METLENEENFPIERYLDFEDLEDDLIDMLNVTRQNIKNIFSRNITCDPYGGWQVSYSSSDEVVIRKGDLIYQLNVQPTRAWDRERQEMVPARTLRFTDRLHNPDPSATGGDGSLFWPKGTKPYIHPYSYYFNSEE